MFHIAIAANGMLCVDSIAAGSKATKGDRSTEFTAFGSGEFGVSSRVKPRIEVVGFGWIAAVVVLVGTKHGLLVDYKLIMSLLSRGKR